MVKLIYTAITSLDGYVADEDGNFGWGAPDAELHAFFNDLERPIGTYLYGRRLYETMIYWETPAAQQPEVERAYAEIWQAADKVVYSRTLGAASSAKTRVAREFLPDEVRRLKAREERDITVGGASLAGQAIAAGLVDEIHLFVAPVVVGGGTSSLPGDVRLDLELVDARRFGSGFVHLHYRI